MSKIWGVIWCQNEMKAHIFLITTPKFQLQIHYTLEVIAENATTSGCMWIWFADSILPALVGFLRALRFLLHLKIRIFSYSIPYSFWSFVVFVYKLAWLRAWGLITYVCAAAVKQRYLKIPVGLICGALQKLQIIIISSRPKPILIFLCIFITDSSQVLRTYLCHRRDKNAQDVS